uniref:Ras family GTPase n=1 Tax=Marseillevirus LCMAC102 TaxID=2506603 RepID=A0A481YV40_9VIRU|nr:MAG: Ras family GTPase [Marseillevirus LCMAC102]
MNNQYKILLVGDKNVGKSSLIHRHLTGHFNEDYTPTLGVDLDPLTFSTNYDPITFNVWDCAGNPDYEGLGIQGYGIQTDAAIVMFDLTLVPTYHNAYDWIENVRDVCGDIPIIVCGNKFDCPNKMKSKNITIHEDEGTRYYDISSRSNYNFEKPFLDIARQLTGHDDLVFV